MPPQGRSIKRAITTPATVAPNKPPTSPSTLFPGLIEGAGLLRPHVAPTRYAALSLTQMMLKIARVAAAPMSARASTTYVLRQDARIERAEQVRGDVREREASCVSGHRRDRGRQHDPDQRRPCPRPSAGGRQHGIHDRGGGHDHRWLRAGRTRESLILYRRADRERDDGCRDRNAPIHTTATASGRMTASVARRGPSATTRRYASRMPHTGVPPPHRPLESQAFGRPPKRRCRAWNAAMGR